MTFKQEMLRDVCTNGRVIEFDKVPKLIQGLGSVGLKPVVVQGVFDVLHRGHLGLFEAAQQLDPFNGVVLAGLDNDATVRQNKGDGRPVNTLPERLHLVAAARPVAFCFGYTDTPRYDDADAYLERWRALSGATVVAAAWDPNRELKEWQASKTGTELAFVDYHHENSTTRMLRSLGYEE